MSRYLLFACLLLPLLARAESLDAVIASGELHIETSIAPVSDAVPGQHMVLTIEIATQRWFTGGTRISLPEVSGLVVLQTDQFAANASERRGASSWVVQRWSLDLFPQRSGSFTLPPIKLQIQVNTSAGNISGSAYTAPLDFEVGLPPALEERNFWVAAPEFKVSQDLDRDPLQLTVGDAFVQDIRFEASDVQAMMLPTVTAPQVAGLKAYPSPPELENRSDRGSMRAQRREQITYIAEQPGDYRLPAQSYYWWNTTAAELQLLELPAIEIKVAAGPSAASGDRASREIDWRATLGKVAMAAALAVLLWLGWRLLPAARYLAGRLLYAWHRLVGAWRAWRRPGLPGSLNPVSLNRENNAGD